MNLVRIVKLDYYTVTESTDQPRSRCVACFNLLAQKETIKGGERL